MGGSRHFSPIDRDSGRHFGAMSERSPGSNGSPSDTLQWQGVMRCVRQLRVGELELDEKQQQEVDDALDPPSFDMIVAAGGAYGAGYFALHRFFPALRTRPPLLKFTAGAPVVGFLCAYGLHRCRELLRSLMDNKTSELGKELRARCGRV